MVKKKDSKQIYQEIQFSEQLLNADLWIKKANELIDAASLLRLEIERYWASVQVKDGNVVCSSNIKFVQGSYFLLIAFAIENYLKVMLILKNKNALKNRLINKLPAWLKSHDLVRLSQDAQFNIAAADEELLVRLSRHSMWQGRYPIPVDSGGIQTIKKLSDGKSYFIAYLGPKDLSRLDKLMKRLVQTVSQEIKQ